MDRDADKPKIVRMARPIGGQEGLPYMVELWNLPRTAPERVIGRAASVRLARAIFEAALNEHLGRRILLRRGAQVLAENG